MELPPTQDGHRPTVAAPSSSILTEPCNQKQDRLQDPIGSIRRPLRHALGDPIPKRFSSGEPRQLKTRDGFGRRVGDQVGK